MKTNGETGEEFSWKQQKPSDVSPDTLTLDERQRSFGKRMEDLGVQEKENVIVWRDLFSKFMVRFLVAQYGFIIIFLIFQGFGFLGFHLDNYIFYILIAGTLVQSYFLVRIIFQYLFSSGK